MNQGSLTPDASTPANRLVAPAGGAPCGVDGALTQTGLPGPSLPRRFSGYSREVTRGPRYGQPESQERHKPWVFPACLETMGALWQLAYFVSARLVHAGTFGTQPHPLGPLPALYLL